MNEWKKVKIGDVCKIVKGTTGIASAEPGKYPLVVTAVERKTCSMYQFDCEAVCIPLVSSSGHGKKSLNNVHYQSGKFALGTILCAVIPNNPDELDARYLHQYLQFYKDTVLVPLMKGAANVSLSMKDIAGIEVPLPPIEKQRELSAMFVSLQEKSLEFKKETDKQIEYVKLLRQSILQDAIEGKLTEDWRKKHPLKKGDPDYDAEALFEKIQTEKQEKGKKQKPLPAITEVEELFAIPASWKWIRLGNVTKINGGFAFKSDLYKDVGIRVIRISDFNETGFINSKIVRYEYAESMAPFCLEDCNILMALTGGTVGKTLFVKNVFEKMVVNQRVATIKTVFPALPKYIDLFVKSSASQNIIQGAKHSSNDNISLPVLTSMPIPLPPLAEQKEIVTHVEAKLQTIAQLETQIATRETTTKQLMQSILKDAFEENEICKMT